MPRKSAAAAVRLATEQGENVVSQAAPAAQKPIPAGVDWPSVVARGYHVVWGRVYTWNIPEFFRIIIKEHYEGTSGRSVDTLFDERNGVYENMPIRFVKDNPNPKEKGIPYVSITQVDELRAAVTNFRRDHEGYDPYQPRDTASQNVSLHVGKDEWFKTELFENAKSFPVEYGLSYHVTKRSIVGFASWEFLRIADDKAVPSKPKPAAKVSPYAKTAYKKTATIGTTGGSLIIDTKGIMTFSKMTKSEMDSLHSEIQSWRTSYLNDIVSKTTTLIFNDVRLLGEDPSDAASMIKFSLDEENNFSGHWKGKGTQKGFVFSTGKLTSIKHYLAIRRSMTEDDYARAWMQRFVEKGAQEVADLEKKQLKLQQDALGISKQLGESRFMLDLMRTGGLEAFKNKLKSMTAVPGIESVNFLPDGIALTTEEIRMTLDGVTHFIGQFYIVLDLMGNKITIQNLTQESKTGAVHPMVGEGGYFCLGSYSGILAQALATSDYEILTMTMLEFLRDPTGLTGTGKNILRKWGTERPTKPEPGKIITVYKGAGSEYNGNEDDEDWDE